MALPNAREGEAVQFHAYPRVASEGTLGDPESIIWSSIRQAGSRSVAEGIAGEIHGITSLRDRRSVGRSLKLYLQQSEEFYVAARSARPNTAPLIYYYAFLNLAKALCELKQPRFHERLDCYRHGLSWKPNPRLLVNLEKEAVVVGPRGVWHVLWEAVTGLRCPAANPTRIRIRDLFALCPEISVECGRAFGLEVRSIDLHEPVLVTHDQTSEAWLRFSVTRDDLKAQRITVPQMLSEIANQRSGYTEILSTAPGLRAFESTTPVRWKNSEPAALALAADIRALNVFTHIGKDQRMAYFLPAQKNLPLRLPQIVVLYSILFWLSSLVRYDPHSVAELTDSPYWILIDGFMSQSRLWLLEQFEWAIYQTETTLWVSR